MGRFPSEREVLVEIIIVGAYAKVSAIDPATGTEVSIAGPANAAPAVLRAAACRKLDYVLKKSRKKSSKNSGPGAPQD